MNQFGSYLAQISVSTPKHNKVGPSKSNNALFVSSNRAKAKDPDPADSDNNDENQDPGQRHLVSVCSPRKGRPVDSTLDESFSRSSRSRWNETAEVMDFDELPLFRATPPSDDETNATAVTLDYFVRRTTLEFPAILPWKNRKMPLKFENPADVEQTVEFKKCPNKKGFSLLRVFNSDVVESNCVKSEESYILRVPAGMSVVQYLQFTPPPESAKTEVVKSYGDVWYFYVSASYWVKLVLVAKVLPVPKKPKKRIAIWTKAPKIPVKSISRGVLKPITQSPMLNKKQNHQQSTLGSTYSKLKEVECDERNILAQPSSSRSKPVNKSATKRAASRTISDTGSPDTRGSKLKKQPKIVQTEPNWRGVVLRNSSSVRRKKTGTQEADTKKSFKSAIKSSPLLRRKPSAKKKKVPTATLR